MEEIFDVYTREGKYIGTKSKSFCHSENPNCYHKPVWIWIINSKGEILVQKRAATKKHHPNLWDMPSAGHVNAGETSIEGAVRETAEELGINTLKEDYLYVGEYISDSAWEIGQIYLLNIDKDISEMKLQQEEVSEVKWLSIDKFKDLFYSSDFVPFKNDYKFLIMNLLTKSIK